MSTWGRNTKMETPNEEGLRSGDRTANVELRRKRCIPTIYTQLQKGKLGDIYRWETTLAPSYLNNKIDCENGLKVWEFNWYRIRDIVKKEETKSIYISRK